MEFIIINNQIILFNIKGINFSLAPKNIPIDDIICNIEYGIRDLPHNFEVTRKDCAIILMNSTPPKRNIRKVEFISLQVQRNNPYIVIIKADKGGAIIILDKSNYVNKMIDHVSNNGSYIKLNKNPIKPVTKEVTTTIKLNNFLKPLFKKLT